MSSDTMYHKAEVIHYAVVAEAILPPHIVLVTLVYRFYLINDLK